MFGTNKLHVGFEVLTAVVMKNSIFWDTAPCSPLKVSRCFEGRCRLHFQGRRISQARNQHDSRWQAGLLLGLLFELEDGSDMFLRNIGLAFNGLHGVVSQKI
jgi:hypothetical protein